MEELKPNMIVGRVNVKDPDSEDNGRIQLKIVPPMDKFDHFCAMLTFTQSNFSTSEV